MASEDMNLGKIEKLLAKCSLKELCEIDTIVKDYIDKAQKTESLTDEEALNQRREERFGTNIMGTLVRATDVRPGERKEFSVTIQDVSRSGMCVKVDTSFVPSRLVEVTFAGPGGKLKHVYMVVVRMRKMANLHGTWLEVGCRSANQQEVRRLRLQEERITKMRTKVHHKKGILILVVGPETESTSKLTARIKAEEYPVRQVGSLRQALESADKTAAQLAIICQGSDLCQDAKLLAEVTEGPVTLATLAIVENEEDRFKLFRAGIDECLTPANRDEFLFHAIERALIGNVVRQGFKSETQSMRALLISGDNTRINLVTFQLEENGFFCRSVASAEEAKKFEGERFDLVMADFDGENAEEFKELRKQFGKLPLIALCEEIRDGHLAMANGASDYLCMPPNKEDVRMILEGSVANIKLPT